MNPRLVTLEAAVRKVVAQYGGVRATERATGLDQRFIARLMSGKRVPSAETLYALGIRAVETLYEVLDHLPAAGVSDAEKR